MLEGGTEVCPYTGATGLADTGGVWYMGICGAGVGAGKAADAEVEIGTKPDEELGRLWRGPRLGCGCGCVEYTEEALDTGS